MNSCSSAAWWLTTCVLPAKGAEAVWRAVGVLLCSWSHLGMRMGQFWCLSGFRGLELASLWKSMSGPAYGVQAIEISLLFLNTCGKGENAWKLILGVSGARQHCRIFSCVASTWLAGCGCRCDPGLHSYVATVESPWAGARRLPGIRVAIAGVMGISPVHPWTVQHEGHFLSI